MRIHFINPFSSVSKRPNTRQIVSNLQTTLQDFFKVHGTNLTHEFNLPTSITQIDINTYNVPVKRIVNQQQVTRTNQVPQYTVSLSPLKTWLATLGKNPTLNKADLDLLIVILDSLKPCENISVLKKTDHQGRVIIVGSTGTKPLLQDPPADAAPAHAHAPASWFNRKNSFLFIFMGALALAVGTVALRGTFTLGSLNCQKNKPYGKDRRFVSLFPLEIMNTVHTPEGGVWVRIGSNSTNSVKYCKTYKKSTNPM